MKLYLYDKVTGQAAGSIDALGYTDLHITDCNGALIYLNDDFEFSLTAGEKQNLRAAYKQRNPSDSDRLAQMEELLAGILYGGANV